MKAGIFIPAYNAEDCIQETLSSLQLQTYTDLDIVVVDDGSSDRTADLVRDMALADSRIRLIQQENQGKVGALNTGIAHVKGEVLMRCDADDIYPAERIAQQLSWLEAHPEFGFLCGGFSAFIAEMSDPILLTDRWAEAEITEEIRKGILRTHLNTYAFRRELLERVAGFRSYFGVSGEDIDFALRLGDSCRSYYLPSCVYKWRLRDGSHVHSLSKQEMTYYEDRAREAQQVRQTTGQDPVDAGELPLYPGDDTNAVILTSRVHLHGILCGAAWSAYEQQSLKKALRLMWTALRLQPWSWQSWRNLAVLGAKALGVNEHAGNQKHQQSNGAIQNTPC